MRATVSLVPALLVTLGLLYLMQLMVSRQSQQMSRVGDYGVVDFVRLRRDSAKPIVPKPRLMHPPKPPGADTLSVSPRLVDVEPALPASPDLSAGMPTFDQPSFSVKPYLGSLPAKAPRSVPAAKPKVAARKPSKPVSVPSTVVGKPGKTDLASLPETESGGRRGGIDGTSLPGLGGGSGPDGSLIPLFKMAPRYPRKAAMAGKEGWVKVAFTITERGTVTDAVVVESRPRRLFNRSALTAIRKWRFKPQVIDGKPVPVRATQVIEFKLASK